jgi:hypothetical protein
MKKLKRFLLAMLGFAIAWLIWKVLKRRGN